MARTSRSHPEEDGSRSVISRSERYLQLEKKRSAIDATPPRIVTKVVRGDKKFATTTTNVDVTSPLSTASVARTCPALPRMEEWAQSNELLEPTIENNDEDDDSDDDGNNDEDDDSDYDGDGGGKCDGEFNKVAKTGGVNDGCNTGSGKGLYYPDDDAFLDDIFDDDYVEKHFSSIPDEKACDRNRNRIMGGPQPPSPDATEEEMKMYERKRKAFTDANRRKLLAALSSVDMNVSPQKQVMTGHTGDQFSHIRLMSVVENYPLMKGHTFSEKNTVMIRIGEEANLRNIKVKVLKSCKMHYEVAGESFYVKVSNLVFQGWTIQILCCRENDDNLIIPTRAMYISEKSLRSPFTGEWLGHLLRSHLETCPGMSYSHMRSLLSNHVHTELITDNLLQEARDWAKLQLFGNADDNVKYCEAVKAAIIGMDHSCEFLYCDRRDVIRQLRATVVREELKRREDKKEPALERSETEEFIKNWLMENDLHITKQLGPEDGPQIKFLTGVFIATSTSKMQVPLVQDVIQADGAHMSFGKYTLFSAYATSANGAMVSLGFAILFGNEDTSNWIKFWKFIKSIHPIVNQPTKTVITDQDKESLASIKQILPEAGLFHCAFHRRQNIKKKFGGGEGSTPLTCLWMYNLLMNCNSMGSIQYLKNKYLELMKPAHVAYLQSLQDDQQFPAARCNVSPSHENMPDVYMYGLTSSSGVESMNRANDDARGKNAVDPLNAALIIIKKEGHRFLRGQKDAHKVSRFSNSLLTKKGMAIMELIFAKCDPTIYRMQMTVLLDCHKFVISKRSAATREYIVILPKMPLNHGSKFGSCTCGFPVKEGIPCDHMVAIVKQGAVPNITRVELMPYWYTRAQWQLQYPKDMVYKSDITWAHIKTSGSCPDILMKYCPSWAAPKKKGRPKKDARKLGIVDYVKQGVAKRHRKNPTAPQTSIKEVHEETHQEDTEQMRVFDELNSNKIGDSKDGLVGNA